MMLDIGCIDKRKTSVTTLYANSLECQDNVTRDCWMTAGVFRAIYVCILHIERVFDPAYINCLRFYFVGTFLFVNNSQQKRVCNMEVKLSSGISLTRSDYLDSKC